MSRRDLFGLVGTLVLGLEPLCVLPPLPLPRLPLRLLAWCFVGLV